MLKVENITKEFTKKTSEKETITFQDFADVVIVVLE